jgi:hypothetical protein
MVTVPDRTEGTVSDDDAARTTGEDEPTDASHRRFGRLPERIHPSETTESVDTRPGDRAGSPAGDPETEAVIRKAGF